MIMVIASTSIGKEDGGKHGKKVGALENAKKVAQNMLKEHLLVNTIVKCTGLSKKGIEELETKK